ncbi:tenascin [Apostichopus japonicus]|uniref:Tenascin n=1 Tax=Stichopus japonicus TaxID=307972 RepID=A0A2G8K2J8_STIJA|nr:tenascin [Apostichopus japonicus]
MDNGGGWTVFQRRTGGSTSFFRNWAAYKNGFGDINVDFWLGNEKLYYLTNQKYYSLRFDVTTSNRDSKYALYSEFRIMSESHNYRLDRLGSHSGTTGTRFPDNNKGKDFSTYDEDNDGCDKYNCALRHRGGWWHSDSWCNYCHGGDNHCDQFHYTGASSCYTFAPVKTLMVTTTGPMDRTSSLTTMPLRYNVHRDENSADLNVMTSNVLEYLV